ncbi:MAG: AAA family ATPase [bacterium]
MEKSTSILNLEEYQIKNHSSWNMLAKRIGVSSATLHMWREGKYSGDNARVDRLVAQFLEGQAMRQQAGGALKFVEIKNAKSVFENCTEALNFGSFNLITGKAGLGKTVGLLEFAIRNDNIHYIRVNDTMNFIAVLKEIAMSVGVQASGNAADIFKRLTQKIKGSSRLFQLDEAHKLNFRSLEIIRDIFDTTESIGSRPGFVLAGDTTLYDRVTGRYNLRTDRNFDQIYSRIETHIELKQMDLEDCALMLRSVFDDVDNNKAQYVLNMSSGNCRNVSNLLKNMQRKGRELTRQNIEKASSASILAA